MIMVVHEVMKVDVKFKVYVTGGIRGNEGGCQVKGLCSRWYTR